MYAGHYRLPYTRSQNPSVFLRNLLTRAEPWHIGVGDSVVGRLVRWVALQALSPFFWSSIRFRHEADPERIEDSPIAISRMVRLCFTYRILPGGYRGGGGVEHVAFGRVEPVQQVPGELQDQLKVAGASFLECVEHAWRVGGRGSRRASR